MIDFIHSQLGQLLTGGLIAIFGKYAWDRWFSQKSRMTVRECELHRQVCSNYRNLNLTKLLGLQEIKLHNGDQEFVSLGLQLTKIKAILEAVLEINLQFCKANPSVDCDGLLKVLASKGLDIDTETYRHYLRDTKKGVKDDHRS